MRQIRPFAAAVFACVTVALHTAAVAQSYPDRPIKMILPFPAGSATDVAGFIKVAQQRASTKALSYGSGNTSNIVGAELLKNAAKIDMINVPYRGTPQALQDLVAGQIEVMFVDPFSAMGFIKSG
jgi:tripartite-type tricarboxylate transporter receptor subunit TctC